MHTTLILVRASLISPADTCIGAVIAGEGAVLVPGTRPTVGASRPHLEGLAAARDVIVLVVHALPAQEIALLRPLHGGCDIEDILNGIALCQHIAVANPDLDAIPITNPAAF